MDEFVANFAHGHKDAMFLAYLATWRGESALEWFSATLDDRQNPVDGFEFRSTLSVEGMSTTGGGSTGGSNADKRSDMERLIEALSRSSRDLESPEKRAYLRAKTAESEVNRKASKRQSDLAFAKQLLDVVAETGVKGKRQKKMERKSKKLIDALVADVDSDELEDSEDDN
jgi:hypothetical protein